MKERLIQIAVFILVLLASLALLYLGVVAREMDALINSGVLP